MAVVEEDDLSGKDVIGHSHVFTWEKVAIHVKAIFAFFGSSCKAQER
jgi:hypothetical protein